MRFYLNVVVAGISIGAVYALFGLGITMIYKATRVPNFAHAAIGAVGAYTFFKTWDEVRLQEPRLTFRVPFAGWAWTPDPPALPMVVALLISMVVVGLLGLVVERFVMRSLAGAPMLNLIIATVALFTVVAGLAGDLFGQRFEAVPSLFPAGNHSVGGVNFSNDALGILIVTTILAVALAAFFRYTDLGIAIRATADSREVARLLGISSDRVASFAWAAGSMLAAVAGILIAPTSGLTSFGLAGLIVFGFAAALFGGFDSLVGTLLGGLLIGVVSNLASVVPWPEGAVKDLLGGAGAPALVTLLVVVGILMLRPRFIFKGIRLDEDSGVSFATAARGINPEDAIRRGLDRAGQLQLLLKDWVMGRWMLAGGIALALLAVPVFAVSYWSTVLAFGVIGALTAASIVVLTGWTGQIGLAPLTFVGVGAFTAAVITDVFAWIPAPLVIPVAGLITIPFAVLVGLPALRLRGFFFALATLTFAFAGQGWLFVQPSLSEKEVDRGVFGDRYTQPIFYTALGIAVLVFLALHLLHRTRVARAFHAIRDSETTAQLMGIDPVRYKLLAFGVSGFVAGVAGALNGFLNPDVQAVAFGLQFSLAAVLSAVVSGVGLLFGAVLSGFLFSVVPQLLATPTEGVNQAPVVIGGLLAISTIRDYPNGLASFLARLVRPFRPGERAAWQGEADEAEEMLREEPERFEHAGALAVSAGD